ncbi:MAG: hypothetical protein F6J87_04290 [Spirulina sp. SIO3F2]|nr:hypothetical protein [Spirulina sp. SIO3F2]
MFTPFSNFAQRRNEARSLLSKVYRQLDFKRLQRLTYSPFFLVLSDFRF